MTSRLSERFAPQQEQQGTDFDITSTGVNTNTTSAGDGIDHASLRGWLFEDFSASDHRSAIPTGLLQPQHLYDVQGINSPQDGTCTLAMLELNHSLAPTLGAETGPSNASTALVGTQPGFHAGPGTSRGFGQEWPDDSAFLLPGVCTDFLVDQPGHGLAGYLGSAEQTGVMPSFCANDQQLAGASTAFGPIGYQNTLAQPGLGHGPGGTQITTSWEMRNNDYFCLYAGCRNPSFKRLGDLERHQNNVHVQTKFFWCRYDGCGRGRPFPRKDKRNEHERKVHHVDYTLVENHW
ncbi:hypothetical protein BFW01_g11019 [Lasiodiplodia theobromae]|uniref:C2H2-type domain-containing protein n=1 Tax=Lasiodiplodia theobromae TaxID=45133 RepID=A0A8H7IQP0_9PEZI|nr:hypothetical protein BFW01_g11019 [Lasiodiplodia theobromae]